MRSVELQGCRMSHLVWHVAKRTGLLSLFLFSTGACVTSSLNRATGELGIDEIGLGFAEANHRSSSDYSEQLVWRGSFPDGATAYAKFTVANIAGVNGRGSFKFSLRDSQGDEVLACSIQKKGGNWHYGKEGHDFQLGELNATIGYKESQLSFPCSGIQVGLTMTGFTPPFRPEGGLLDRGGAFYETSILIPRGQLDMSFEALDGLRFSKGSTESETKSKTPKTTGQELLKAFPSRGYGYLEQRSGNIPPYRLAKSWFHILSIDQERTVLMSAFEPAESNVSPGQELPAGWVLVVDNAAVQLYEPSVYLRADGFSVHEKTGYEVPKAVFMYALGESSFQGVVQLKQLKEAKDDLSDLSALERIVVKRLMHPWTFTYPDAAFLFRGKQPTGDEIGVVSGKTRFLFQKLN